MTNALFSPGREGFLSGEISWTAATVKVSLVRGYTFSASHKFVSEITGAGGVLAATQTLSSKTATSGVADAADPTFLAVTANGSAHSLLIYQSSAVSGGADVAASAQRVIGWIDTGTNFPVYPNAGDITVTFDNGAYKIFKL